jgi:hypothetical protein
VEGRKPDNNGYQYYAQYSGHTVTFTVEEQMTIVAGDSIVEIVFYSDSVRVGTANFILAIEPAPLNDNVKPSETSLPTIQEAVRAADNAAASAEQAETAADEAADTLANFATVVAEQVEQMQIHEGQTVIDGTLTVSGAAADAKATGDKVTELKNDLYGESIQNYEDGYNLDGTGGVVAQSGISVSEYIPYTWTGSTRYYCNDYNGLTYRIDFYDSSKSFLKSYINVPTSESSQYRGINAENQVTGTVGYVRFTFKTGTTGRCVKNQNPEPAPYWSAISEYIVGLINKVASLESDKLSIADMTYSTSAANLTNGTTLEIATDVDSRKNDAIDFRADITSFTSVTVGHGYMINHGMWITVDATNITVYDDSDGGQVAQKAHGLTISDYIHVLINRKKDSTVDIEIMTGTGSYTWNTNWFGNRGSVFAFCNGTLTSVKFNAIFRDLSTLIYMFGDSYQSFLSAERYPYYLVQNEFNDYLAVGFPGAQALHGIAAFRAILAKAKPKFVVWALGMNGSDSETAINPYWKDYTDEVIATCDANNITLILTTTPNVPERIHTFKNDYVRNSGKRYIDFAKAVGAESQGSTWYTGMLSSDNVHPTDLGAKALYTQLLADFPEIMK